MRQAGGVFLRYISGAFSVPLFQPHAYPLPGVATRPESVSPIAPQDRGPDCDRRGVAGVALADLLTMRAARMDSAQPLTERDIAVSIETTSPGGRVSLFARASGLSSREAELLGHLVAGADTRDMARLMFLSEHTVQDHLKSIFAKTATRTRRTLLIRVLGT